VTRRRDRSRAAVDDGDRARVPAPARAAYCLIARARHTRGVHGLPIARLPLPGVLGARVRNGLPLHVRDGVRSAAGERDLSNIRGTSR
jgi:hypothetical protein